MSTQNLVRLALMVGLAFCLSPLAAAPPQFAPGDTLELTVAGQDSLGGEQIVDEQGVVRVGLIGDVKVAGRTERQVEAEITTALKKFIRKPRVRVKLAKLAEYKVSVLGDVRRPQVYMLERGATVLDALLGAGGPTVDGEQAELTLIRAGKSEILPLSELMAGKAPDKNLLLQTGDVLQVRSLPEQKIVVLGYVGKQGPIRYRPGMTLADALAEVGGLREDADGANATLKRDNKDAEPIDLDALVRQGKAEANRLLQAGDTIYVPALPPESEDGTTAGSSTDGGVDPSTLVVPDGAILVRVLGAVSQSGPYVITATDPVEKITEAILAAENFSGSANTRAIIIARRVDEAGKPARGEAYKVNYSKLIQGKVKKVPDLQNGDVIYVPDKRGGGGGGGVLKSIFGTLLRVATFGFF